MSIDLTAIIRHQLNAEAVLGLPDMLNRDKELADTMRHLNIAAYGKLRGNTNSVRWSWDKYRRPADSTEIGRIWDAGDPVDISGPVCSLYVSRYQFHVSSFFRVMYVADEVPLQNLLWTAMKRFHSIVNRDVDDLRLLYAPDSAYAESRITEEYQRSYADLINWASNEFGPPLADVKSMVVQRDDGTYDLRGYVVLTLENESAEQFG